MAGDDSPGSTQSNGAASDPSETKAISVILVDDTQSIRRLLRTLLERSGAFKVVGEAINGAEAVNVAGARQPDLVVLDHFMPVMDGMEAIPLIRASAPSSRIVMLSSVSSERLVAKALKTGAVAYLDMRSSPEGLVSRLLDAYNDPLGHRNGTNGKGKPSPPSSEHRQS